MNAKINVPESWTHSNCSMKLLDERGIEESMKAYDWRGEERVKREDGELCGGLLWVGSVQIRARGSE